jgi:DNA-binding MarR family transcriptional regulator
MGMERDPIDALIDRWREVRPDLDPAPLAVVGRILVLAQYLDRRVGEALAEFGLSLGQFDILATLRREGPGAGLTPTQLLRSVMLSSGGMTNRLDRLERSGLIQRGDDPNDRRGVVVRLTALGTTVIDAATAARFAEAARSIPPFAPAERSLLADLLRRCLLHLTAPRTELFPTVD